MKIKIVAVGKIKENYIIQGIQEYTKRLTPYTTIEIIEVNDEKAPESYSEKEVEMVKNIEGKNILSKISSDEYVIALAIEGNSMSSEQFSKAIETHMTYGRSKLCFIIGGSNGLSQDVYKRANELLSFSKMTFPHQLMRLILMEQVYRAFKIIHNEPYHK